MTLQWLILAALPAMAHSNPPAERYSTMLGLVSYAVGIVVDSGGYAYATGVTDSALPPPCTLPILGPVGSPGPYGYVTKMAPDGSQLWTACLSVPSAGRAIALDASGAVWVAGGTTVSKLGPNGDTITSSIVIPTATIDAITFDKAGRLYVAGIAQTGLLTTPGAYIPACTVYLPCPAGFIAKLDPTGAVQYSTYTGLNASAASINAIAVDSQGNAWMTGTGNGGSPRFCGSGFVSEFDPNGAKILFNKGYGGVYYGQAEGCSSAAGMSIAVDSMDNVYAVGWTLETSYISGYLLKVDPAGNAVSTNIGTFFRPIAVAVDAGGKIYVGMSAYDGSAPAMNCANKVTPAALTVYDSDGSTILSAAYHAGSSTAIAVDANQDAYVIGQDIHQRFSVTKYDTKDNPTLQLGCLVNAANPPVSDTAVAPGEIITLFGLGFTSSQPLMQFDGHPAVILYSSDTQINAVVPFEVSQPSTLVSVQGGTQMIGPFALPVTMAVPRLFTLPGTQEVAALNQDATVNSASNPATAGSVVSVFLSGAGALNPPLSDGQLGPLVAPFPVPALGVVTATAGGASAAVIFVGQAPGQVAGLLQINIRIPAGTASGPAPIQIQLQNSSYNAGQPFIEVR